MKSSHTERCIEMRSLLHDVAKTHTERDTHRERHTERFSESPVALLGLRAFAAAVRFDDREERIGWEKALTCSAQGMMTQRLREIQTQTQTQTRARARTHREALSLVIIPQLPGMHGASPVFSSRSMPAQRIAYVSTERQR